MTAPPFPGSRLCAAPAASAGGLHSQDVAGVQAESALVGKGFGSGLVAAWQEPVLAGRSGGSTGQAPGLAVTALGDQGDRDVFEHLQVALDAVAASGTAGAAASGADLVAADPHGERALQRLDGRISRIRHARVNRRLAGDAEPRAGVNLT